MIWQSIGGETNAGVVRFDPIDVSRTRVRLEMSYEPEGALENVGDMRGVMSRQVEGDLERFREFIEQRGMETGPWRGEITNPDAPGGHTSGRPANKDGAPPPRVDGDATSHDQGTGASQ